jgi:hypothetical protein
MGYGQKHSRNVLTEPDLRARPLEIISILYVYSSDDILP